MPACLQKALDQRFASYDFAGHVVQTLYDQTIRQKMKNLWNEESFPQAREYRQMVVQKIKTKQKLRYIERVTGDDWRYWEEGWRREWSPENYQTQALSGYDLLVNKMKELKQVRAHLRQQMEAVEYPVFTKENKMDETFGIKLRRNKPHPKIKGDKAWDLTPRILKKRMKRIRLLTEQQKSSKV